MTDHHDDTTPRAQATGGGVGRCHRLDPNTLNVERLVFLAIECPATDPTTVEYMYPPAAAWDIGRLSK